MSRKNFFRLTRSMFTSKPGFEVNIDPVVRKKFFRATGSMFTSKKGPVQIAYSDPPRQDLRELGSSENALLGPTPTEFAGNVGNTTGPVQMPCRTHPDRICGGG